MNIKPIRNDADLQAAFKRLEMVYQAQEGTLESDEMEVRFPRYFVFQGLGFMLPVSRSAEQ